MACDIIGDDAGSNEMYALRVGVGEAGVAWEGLLK
jgi:hypothetical protein